MHKFVVRSVLWLLVLILVLNSACSTTSSIFTANKESKQAAQYYVDLAASHLRQKNHINARVAIDKALKLDSDSAAAYNLLGLIYLTENNLRQAAKFLEQALSIQVDFTAAHNNYAIVLVKMGNLDTAIEHMKIVLGNPLYPRLANANYTYALIISGRDIQQAIKYLQIATNIDKHPIFYLALAACLVKTGDYLAAENVINQYHILTASGHSIPSINGIWLAFHIAQQLHNTKASNEYHALLQSTYPYVTLDALDKDTVIQDILDIQKV